MALILWTISIATFMAYFYAIWLWYVGLVPLLVFLIALVYYISGISFKSKSKDIIQKYGLFFAWIIVLAWLFWVLKFLGIDTIQSWLFLIWLNVLVRVWSYLFRYNDGKTIAQVWYYLSALSLLVYIWIWNWFEIFFISFGMIWALSLAIISFIVFIIGIYHHTEKYISYTLFILLIWSIGLSLHHKITNIYIFLLVAVTALGLLYTYLHHILAHKPPTDSQKKEISVRRILSWERVLKEISHSTILSNKIYNFVSDIPLAVQYFLEWSNMIIIILLIYLYFQNALTLQWGIDQIFYRLITAGFIINVLLLKKINYTSVVQRLLTFVVINFAIYISLFSAFQSDISKIVFLWIIRNIFCAMSVFHIHKTKIWLYLKKIDYLFWIFTTILALVVNVILLVRTEITGQLLFPIILLYVWIQSMILYYSIKYVNKIQEVEI